VIEGDDGPGLPPGNPARLFDKFHRGDGEGAMQLRLTATNTAFVTANPTKTVYADNSTPTISLSGPTDAPSTGGPQYVTAVGGGSPSGIAGFSCSTDGGPPRLVAGTSAQVPVSGIGQHTVVAPRFNGAIIKRPQHRFRKAG